MDESKETLSKLNRDYLRLVFCSPLLHTAYEALFDLAVHVFQNHSWDGVMRRYDVPDTEGCLKRWVDAVLTGDIDREPDQKLRELTRICLEDFLMLAIGEDPYRYLKASGPEIVEQLDKNVFDRTSRFFLGSLLWHLLEREKEKFPLAAETQFRQIGQKIADSIIKAFESEFYRKKQRTHRDLMRIICEHLDLLVGTVKSFRSDAE